MYRFVAAVYALLCLHNFSQYIHVLTLHLFTGVGNDCPSTYWIKSDHLCADRLLQDSGGSLFTSGADYRGHWAGNLRLQVSGFDNVHLPYKKRIIAKNFISINFFSLKGRWHYVNEKRAFLKKLKELLFENNNVHYVSVYTILTRFIVSVVKFSSTKCAL